MPPAAWPLLLWLRPHALPSHRFWLYSGHDTGPIMPMLFAYHVHLDFWCPYASMITVELYSADTPSGYAVRFVYNGDVIHVRAARASRVIVVAQPWHRPALVASSHHVAAAVGAREAAGRLWGRGTVRLRRLRKADRGNHPHGCRVRLRMITAIKCTVNVDGATHDGCRSIMGS